MPALPVVKHLNVVEHIASCLLACAVDPQALGLKGEDMRKFIACYLAAVGILHIGSAVAAQTVASPKLQKTMLGLFPQSQKCGESVGLKVLSSDQSPDAKVENGNLVAGEIREVWQATTCDSRTQVRYMFRFAPGTNGELKIVGFERTR